ncbi:MULTISPECIES: hypothetical protein [Pseudomonas]|jgi:hypothetical protein|uniref:Uncharacterized protein n=1 Tax=Pseudomonas promysalinigenes TaxID=485898 RepID=A0ABY6AQE7_9PSED|nr:MULTISPECIES: hypothetical protein [Pseudomonas]UXH41866.1 hypothetical protein N5C08_10220 [Pseudomonas promysalinigenes]
MAHLALYKLDLLDAFEARKADWTYADLDKLLTKFRPSSCFEDGKGLIIAAHKEGSWPRTVKRYLLTHYLVHQHIACELDEVFTAVVATLTEQERQNWGV